MNGVTYTGAGLLAVALVVAYVARGRWHVAARLAIGGAGAGLLLAVVGVLMHSGPDATLTVDGKTVTIGAYVANLYATSLRTSLCSGFLGLGGFLLSLKVFIVVRMKEEFYDRPQYAELVAKKRRRLAKAKNLTDEAARKSMPLYGALDRLRRLLFWTIISAFSAALAQITIGLDDSLVSALICITIAGFAVALLVQVLVLINANLRQWFGFIERHSNGEAGSDEGDELDRLDAAAANRG